MAFDDQCTGANPRYPLISELKAILIDSYYGRKYQESYDRLIPVGSSMASLVAAHWIPEVEIFSNHTDASVGLTLSSHRKKDEVHHSDNSLSSVSSHVIVESIQEEPSK